jgi:hypothetical protein
MANVPVRSASVQITWDDRQTIVIKTDTTGRFQKAIELPPGRHTLIARFTGDEYPIYPSESDPVTLDVSLIPGVEMDYRLITLVIVAIVILILFLGAGAYYYRRISLQKTHIIDLIGRFIPGKSREPGPPAGERNPDAPGEDPGIDTNALKSESETLTIYYARILRDYGLSAASRIVYQQIAGRVARDLHIRRHQALTAREMAKTCRGKPYCGTFSRFVAAYERVRYGGQNSVKDQKVFETAMELTEEQTGGDDH